MIYEIYYNKKDSQFIFGLGGKPKTRRDIKEWYVQVASKHLSGIVEHNLEKIFTEFNLSRNPLGTQENQKMLREKGVSHTSMSVGDLVKVNSSWWYCDDAGWTELELRE
jgi:hypothetical protein